MGMAGGAVSSGYHETRFKEEGKRDILWKTLWRCYFRHRVPADACVLDLGAGYGQFINNVEARRRIAIDAWPGFAKHLVEGVEAKRMPAMSRTFQ